jgi:AraC family transcriptional regulator
MGPSSDLDRLRLRAQYQSRINRVVDYIDANLADDLSLTVLADVAAFSRYHFHRIFHALVGETVNQFIGRIRLEKAAAFLLNNKHTTVTEIALECGFSGSATFARAFRERYGMSASAWRERKICNTDSKDRQTVGNGRKAFGVVTAYSVVEPNSMTWEVTMTGNTESNLSFTVDVRDVPDMTVAYVRHIGPYQGDGELFGRLIRKICTWAGPRGLLGRPDGKLLAVYHDSPELTDESQLRTSVCISVPEDTRVDGEIGKMVIRGGPYAIAHFEIDQSQYGAAWDALMGGWLPESGYQPADGLCYEDFRNDPKDHPEGKHMVDICVPVKPL